MCVTCLRSDCAFMWCVYVIQFVYKEKNISKKFGVIRCRCKDPFQVTPSGETLM